MTKDSSALVPVTQDLIRELRWSGKGDLADQLLKAFHADVSKAGKEAYQECYRQQRKIAQRFGVCSACLVRPSNDNLKLCAKCLGNHKKYDDKQRDISKGGL